MEATPDWLKVITEATDEGAPAIEIPLLLPNDQVIVSSSHTHYKFTMISQREAELETSRSDRPSGRVVLMGCTFGLSTSIKPDQLFVGGNLEFTHMREGVRRTHLTTAITALRHLRKKP
jgi:hypothetical protein